MEPPLAHTPELQVELRRFTRLAEARERGLVLSACGITHAIAREGEEWLLLVGVEDGGRARVELEAYEHEQALRAEVEVEVVQEQARTPRRFWSLPLFAMVVVGFAVCQAELGERWREAGLLVAEKVVEHGQWWRTITALTLHGDAPHVLANLGAGLLFGGLLVPSLGQGLTWFLVLVTGALGNYLTAWAYHPEHHRSLGASTAVFGALGLLVGDSLGLLLQSRGGRSWWRWVPPLGAGVGLLAFLGAGEGKSNVDVLAHLWGFGAGLPVGFVAALLKPHLPLRGLQIASGVSAPILVALAWVLAVRGG